MKSLFFLPLLILYSVSHAQEINIAGAMSRIMRKNDFSANVSLDTLKAAHLYGLGPIENLKGEILVLNGKSYVTAKTGDTVTNSEKPPRAAMLVYAYVKNWISLTATVQLADAKALEKWIETTATAQGIDISRPFVFRIEARAKSAKYHVIDWKEGVTHTTENHKQFAFTIQDTAQQLTLLGFYSDAHQGIFTHHTSNMHVHVLNRANNVVGHLDDIVLEGGITVFFSKD